MMGTCSRIYASRSVLRGVVASQAEDPTPFKMCCVNGTKPFLTIFGLWNLPMGWSGPSLPQQGPRERGKHREARLPQLHLLAVKLAAN